jgi:hypothetical protein
MASNYEGFVVMAYSTAGVLEHVGAGVSVKARLSGAGSDLAESPLTTDADGQIAAGSFASTSPGDIVNFRVENLLGLSNSVAQATT